MTIEIAFNGQRLAGQRLGVGRYIEYMLRYWGGMLAPDERVTVFLRQPLNAASTAYLDLPASIRTCVLPPKISGIPWENVALGRRASRSDVLFCPAYTAPVGYRGRLVVATHSTNDLQPGAHSWWHKQTYARLDRHCARLANRVIVPSHSTKADIARAWGIPEDRIAVVPQGADDCFRPITEEAVLTAVRRRFFGSDRPYLLFVGKASTRRNIPLLLQAFARLRRERRIPHGLLLFGPNPANLPLAKICADLGIAGDVVQTDGQVVDHSELVPIYNAADVFVHPSLYEGWSMTTVEALACGTAVIAANRGGLGEVAAGHALMLEDLSVESLVNAVGSVLTDEGLRQELKRSAFARGRNLRWRETTRQTLDVVRDIARR